MESTGEATDQNMLAPDWSPIHPRLLRRSRFKPCLWPDYLQLLETCMCDPNKSLQEGSDGGGGKNIFRRKQRNITCLPATDEQLFRPREKIFLLALCTHCSTLLFGRPFLQVLFEQVSIVIHFLCLIPQRKGALFISHVQRDLVIIFSTFYDSMSLTISLTTEVQFHFCGN